jgi:hypothetical protein
MWNSLRSKFRLRRLRSQLILTFLAGFLGIGIGIGVPVLLLINRQASSQAQLLLDQSVVASKAFISSEQSNLQSLALLVSQRPTLQRILEEKSFASLEEYLNTLKEGANLDFLLICSNGSDITASEQYFAIAGLCNAEAASGYFDSGDELHLFSSVDLEVPEGTQYKVIVGKRVATVLIELQN